MTPLSCPNCGAPAQAIPGQTTATCSYCKQSFQLPEAQQPTWGAPPPPMAPPVVHQIVVVPPGESYETATAVAAGWVGFRLVMALIPLVVIVLIGGVSWFSMRGAGRMTGIGPSSVGGWGGSTPLVCGGNDQVSASAVSLAVSGPGITATGNCHVQCSNCTINAGTGVVATGNADVELVDSHVTGSSQGIVASGNASVHMLGSSTLSGRVVKTDNADVIAPQPAGGAPAPTAPAAKPPLPTSSPSRVVPVHAPSSHH
jgi:hypothetical protein